MIASDSCSSVGVVQNQALLLLIALFLVLSIPAHSDSVTCSDYAVHELGDICSDNSATVSVYDNVTSTGLNELADGWSTDVHNYHLRVVPPGTYVLNRPIVLEPGNRMLPHPTMPLPAGKTLRAIELVASEDFQKEGEYFYLLKLNEVSIGGGMEIHGSKLPDNVISSFIRGSREAPRNTLVLASGTTDTYLAGSVLTGHESLDALYLNTSTPSDGAYINNDNGVRLQRNYLRQAGASASVILSIDAERPYVFRNNGLFVELGSSAASSVSGVYLAGGRLKADISNNDFILPPRRYASDSSAQRRAIETGDSTGSVIDFNAMYTPGSTALNPNDIGIYDSRSKTDGKRLMSFASNSFSPHMTPGRADQDGTGGTMKVMFDGAQSTPLMGAYHLDDPIDFMNYRGMLGVMPRVTAAFLGGNNGTCIVPEEVSDTDLKSDDLSPVEEYIYENSEPCYSCQASEVGVMPIFFAIVIPILEVAGGVSCCIFCGRRGMGKSGCGCRRRRRR